MAGWTLAYQMGVKFDRILDRFDGPFEELKDEVPPPAAKVERCRGRRGLLPRTRMNDSFRAVNRLLAAGEDVRRLDEAVHGRRHDVPAGHVLRHPQGHDAAAPREDRRRPRHAVHGTARPGREASALKPVRVGLWDRYGGSMPAGWTRLTAGAVRVPVQGGLPAATRPRRAARNVRRAHLRGRRHPRPRRSATGARAGAEAADASARKRHPRGVQAAGPATSRPT